MSLNLYHTKRNFRNTPEPESSHRKASEFLHFCIQKHAARRLHYDFRLECRGVLLSWAVPKGPSLNPHDKRLAIQVEDHPLEYQYFEGVIPKGNYGAGTVEIWDHGTYGTPKTMARAEVEHEIEDGLKRGHFSIILHGERLHGEFIFQKLKNDPEEKSWLLIKKSDKAASDAPIIEEGKKQKPEKKKP